MTVLAVELDGTERLELVILAVGILAALIVLAVTVRRRLFRSDEVANSFFGGLTASYVFLYLLPEIEQTHAVLGERVYLIILAGFLVFYATEYLTRFSDGADARGPSPTFWVRATFLWIYSFLFVFTLPESMHDSLTFFLLSYVAIGVRISFEVHDLAQIHPVLFDGYGRWWLASAPIAAGVVDLFVESPPVVIVDALVALLAGFMLLSVFADELIEQARSDFRLFLAGTSVYLAVFFSKPIHVG